jgi:signal transduction histidine kinase
LNHFSKVNQKISCKAVRSIINLQICIDLFLLTVILHFSGGIENPLVFYFIFHMIIASILLSTRESYLQATFAVLLFSLMVLLEHKGLLPHYCLTGFVPFCLQQDKIYVLGTLFVFVTALYLTVYMTNYISVRLKRAEHAYRQANVMLQEKDRIKDEYVLRVTHDIKGHLSTIQGCLGIIVNKLIGQPDDQKTDLIKRAHRRAVELSNFVKALLRLTQMRLNNNFEMEIFSLRDVLLDAVNSVKNKANDKFITLNCNIGASVDSIFGDRFSIEEMITNLLLNAIKYTGAGGTVELRAKNHENEVLIDITDTGIGIPPDEQDRIFDEFFRATNAKAVESDGTGLGLSIVKHIIERHGGNIRVESEEGNGTTFKLRIPLGLLKRSEISKDAHKVGVL